MKIAILGALEETIPPIRYGGIERVTSYLTEELVHQGHDVTLFASGDSTTTARLVPVYPVALRHQPDMEDRLKRELFKLMGGAEVLQQIQSESFDVVSDQTGFTWLLPWFRELSIPVVTTLHGSLDASRPYDRLMYERYPQHNYISISFAQRRPLPQLHYVANIYNAIDLPTFPFEVQPDDYLVFFGRMSREKGLVQAIALAQTTQQKLIIAGKVDVNDTTFFEQEIKPAIDGQHIQYIGELNHAQKVAVLGKAKALIAPLQWEEPFGLYFIEAMACGTPVIALRRGSVEEIITPGVTGIICETLADMAQAIKQLGSIDRTACFESVHHDQRFTITAMTEQYVHYFEQLKSAL